MASLFLSRMGGIDVYLLDVIDKCASEELIDFYLIRNKLKEIMCHNKHNPLWLLVIILCVLLGPFIIFPLIIGKWMPIFSVVPAACLFVVIYAWIVRYATMKLECQFTLIVDAVQSRAISRVQDLRKIIERRLSFAKIVLLVIPIICMAGFEIIYGLS
jgi:hypothetical protein